MTHPRIRTAWPRGRAPKRFLGTDPVKVVKSLVLLMRDRGKDSPDDLRGCTRAELEYVAMVLKVPKRTSYQTFDAALEDAIAAGWIETYECGDQLLYLPNYRHACPTHRAHAHPHARGNAISTPDSTHPERENHERD